MIVELPAPTDLAWTLGAFQVGRADPSLRITGTTAWRATRTPEGPATVQIVASDARTSPPSRLSTTFAARAWGPGGDWALGRLGALLGADDGPEAFVPDDPVVGRLARRHPGLRFGRSGCVVEGLVPTILEQKVTTVEALCSWRALCRAHGEPAPGPAGSEGLRLRPDPARLAALRYSDLHRFGVERRRAEVILRVCRRARSLDALAAGPVAAPIGRSNPAGGVATDRVASFRAALESLPGIGPWSSSITAQQALGDADSVVVGDYNLPHLVAWNLAGEPRATDARMLELLEPYRGHRARVVRLLASAGRAPRFAPKQRLRAIAAI